jgi:hypothetical protein
MPPRCLRITDLYCPFSYFGLPCATPVLGSTKLVSLGTENHIAAKGLGDSCRMTFAIPASRSLLPDRNTSTSTSASARLINGTIQLQKNQLSLRFSVMLDISTGFLLASVPRSFSSTRNLRRACTRCSRVVLCSKAVMASFSFGNFSGSQKISTCLQVHAVLFVVRLGSSGPPLIIRMGMKEAWLRD